MNLFGIDLFKKYESGGSVIPTENKVGMPFSITKENGTVTIAHDIDSYYVDCSGMDEIELKRDFTDSMFLDSVRFVHAKERIVLKTYLEMAMSPSPSQDNTHWLVGMELPSSTVHYVNDNGTWKLYDEWYNSVMPHQGGDEEVDDAD
jgi:hypothetical protein